MTTLQKVSTPTQLDESILVVKRTHLFPCEADAWHGLKKVNFENYLNIIQAKKEFCPRSHMELDPHYKQIIPYLIFNYQDHYFMMQRHAQASETRLQNKFSLGIGGHVRQEDIKSNSLFDWAQREFHEEVNYAGTLAIEPLGILNDDSNEVGKVHIGFVLLLKGNSPDISIKSELKSGTLMTLHECSLLNDRLESWSQFVVHHLIDRT